jgi:pyruvate/2-oxoglutarate dehydrogenase complex dihydrolipoamide acyltransferase (E2) component
VVREGAVAPGRALTLTLACDHRILYGTLASRFLGRIKTLIQEGTL